MPTKQKPDGSGVWVFPEDKFGKDPSVAALMATEDEELFDVHFVNRKDMIKGSYGAVLYVLEHGFKYFVWDTDRKGIDEPLCIDAFTASAMKKVRDAFKAKDEEIGNGSDKHKIFERRCAKSRVDFGAMVELTWRCFE